MTTTTATATTKTQHTTEKQTTTQSQQPKTITITAQQAEQLAQQLGFKPIYKKAEAYIRHLEHVLRHIGREVRRRFLEELILKGEAELPALVVTGYRINWDALQTTLQQLLKETDLPEAVKKAMLERLRQLEEEIKKVPNTEELIKLIQKELGGLLEKPVINLASLYSSIASYLAEHGVSPSKIKQIIDEIQEKVFGKGVLYWMPSSPQEIEQKLKQLEQILAQNNIPIYETETKLVPLIIKNYVVKNPKELIEKWVEQKLGNTQEAKQVAQAIYTTLQTLAQEKGYTNLQNIPLTELTNLLTQTIQQVAQGKLHLLTEDLIKKYLNHLLSTSAHGYVEFEGHKIRVWTPAWWVSKQALENLYHKHGIQGLEKFLEIVVPAMRRALKILIEKEHGATIINHPDWGHGDLRDILINVLKEMGIPAGRAKWDIDEIWIQVPGVGKVIVHPELLLYEISPFLKLSSENTLFASISKLLPNYQLSPSVLESEFLKVGGEELVKPEKTVTYQMEISFKVPRFQSLITEELAVARHRAEEVLNRFYQEMHRIYRDLFRKVFRLVRVRLRII